jgi:hypothetical protein
LRYDEEFGKITCLMLLLLLLLLRTIVGAPPSPAYPPGRRLAPLTGVEITAEKLEEYATRHNVTLARRTALSLFNLMRKPGDTPDEVGVVIETLLRPLSRVVSALRGPDNSSHSAVPNVSGVPPRRGRSKRGHRRRPERSSGERRGGSSSSDGPSLEEAINQTINETSIRAAELTRGCGIVMYTTIFYPLRTNPADPTPKCREQWTTARSSTKLCCVLVTGRPTAHALLRDFNTTRFRPWRMLVMDHQHGGGRSQGRFWSRVAKILPHRIFTTVPVSVFVDFKLELRQDPRLLVSSMLTSRNASFAAWRHQCALEYPATRSTSVCATHFGSKDPWIFQEADFLAQMQRSGDHSKVGTFWKLERQMERYRGLYDSGELTFENYIEGALLLRHSLSRDAREVSDAWWSEYTHRNSSDRDQMSLSYAVNALVKRHAQEQRQGSSVNSSSSAANSPNSAWSRQKRSAWKHRKEEEARNSVISKRLTRSQFGGYFFAGCVFNASNKRQCQEDDLAHWTASKNVAVVKARFDESGEFHRVEKKKKDPKDENCYHNELREVPPSKRRSAVKCCCLAAFNATCKRIQACTSIREQAEARAARVAASVAAQNTAALSPNQRSSSSSTTTTTTTNHTANFIEQAALRGINASDAAPPMAKALEVAASFTSWRRSRMGPIVSGLVDILTDSVVAR